MAAPNLEGVDLRLARADECLALLYGQRSLLLDRKGNSVTGHYDADAGEYVFCVVGDPPPATWGMATSEFAHCLRAALDNTLWQLVIARGGTPSRKTQFPIYEDKTDSEGKSNTAKARRQTRGVLPEDFTIIEGYQPYKARVNPNLEQFGSLFGGRQADALAAWHPLALLGYLNDIDKHRYLHPAYASASIPAIHYGKTEPVPILFAAQRLGLGYGREMIPIFGIPANAVIVNDSVTTRGATRYVISDDDPTEVMRVLEVVPTPGKKPQMKMEPSPTLEISFSNRERPITVYDLIDIRATVIEIIDRFRPVIV